MGAILHHQDGQANPLKLLMALAADVRRMGGRVLTGKTVTDVTKPDGFRVTCADGTVVSAGKVMLSAGLGAAGWVRSWASRHRSGRNAARS